MRLIAQVLSRIFYCVGFTGVILTFILRSAKMYGVEWELIDEIKTSLFSIALLTLAIATHILF